MGLTMLSATWNLEPSILQEAQIQEVSNWSSIDSTGKGKPSQIGRYTSIETIKIIRGELWVCWAIEQEMFYSHLILLHYTGRKKRGLPC